MGQELTTVYILNASGCLQEEVCLFGLIPNFITDLALLAIQFTIVLWPFPRVKTVLLDGQEQSQSDNTRDNKITC
jgi:hypothetical protein